MRSYGPNPINFPLPPDTVNTIIAGTTAQAMDWPTDTQLVRLSGISTGGALMNFYVNMFSTAAALPSSGSTSSTAGTTGVSHPIQGSAIFQVPANSTGFSVIARSSGYIHAECYQKGG